MKLLHVGDLHTTADTESNSFFGEIRDASKGADLVLFGGDLTDAGMPEEYQQFEAQRKKFTTPTFGVRGNHDTGHFMKCAKNILPSNAKIHFESSSYPVYRWNIQWWEQVQSNIIVPATDDFPAPYSKTAQPLIFKVVDGVGPYYSFDFDEYHFICLDTCRWFLEETQFNWLESEVKENRKRPTLVCMHHNVLPTGAMLDSTILWNHPGVIRLIKSNPQIIALLSAHVHFNRVWDFYGTKIITTGRRRCRNICLAGGRVEYIEPLEDYEKLDEKFIGRYFLPSEVYARSFRCNANDIWSFPTSANDVDKFGWFSDDRPGGLGWSLEIVSEQIKQSVYIGVSFATTSPWTLSISADGGDTIFKKSGIGSKGAPINLSEKVEFEKAGTYIARLNEEPPAKGHAGMFFSVADKRLSSINLYENNNDR